MKLRNILYIVLIVLINIASTTLFFRIDLTENRSYSLSKSSQELVANLEEPLSIKVFLSENLPVPYNTLERDIRDILGEYKLKANKHFNYSIDLIKKDVEPEVKPETYGINSVNIQSIEQDEMRAVSAYIGMSFIHGDLSHTIPAIQYNQNLEYTITNTIRKLTEKTTSLLGLEENIKATLLITPELLGFSKEFKNYNSNLESIIEEINRDYFGRVSLNNIEPKRDEINSYIEEYSLNQITLEDSFGRISTNAAALIIEGPESFHKIELLYKDLFGRNVIVSPEELTQELRLSIDKMIGAGTRVGYLVSNGTIPMGQSQQMMFQQSQDPQINALNQIITDSYKLQQVDLTEGEISENIKTLIIARPKEKFTERQLYLLDQFLLKGNSLLIALDTFDQDMQMAQYGQEKYNLIDHGLTELLKHHGISVEPNMVMDENSFKQMQRDNQGSIVENQLYMAPQVSQKNINTDLDFMNGVNELLTLKNAEIKAVDPEDDSVKTLFSSSESAWNSTADNLTMNPAMIFPAAEKAQYSLAALKEGSFTSFFINKDIPAKEIKEAEEESEVNSIEGVDEVETLVKESDTGRLMVLGSSDLLTDQLINKNFQSNVIFIQNTIDYLSGRGDYTQMRSKGVFNRPMDETSPAKRNFIKSFNIAGIPILVALTGLLAYGLWNRKRRKIMNMFQGGNSEE